MLVSEVKLRASRFEPALDSHPNFPNNQNNISRKLGCYADWQESAHPENLLPLQFNRNIALQGEVIGEGVQGNPYKLRGQTIRFFSIYDIDRRGYMPFKEFLEVARLLTLETVPIVAVDYKLENDINGLVRMATRKSLLCSDAWAEGLVIRPLVEGVK
ncbi:MAG: hypothetical protein KDD45_09350 [Bdellovibrionales bacterium]|nr:hypothetical protein [Bdellovibrionales bacterium]